MPAEYTYTDLQVRVLDTDPDAVEAALLAVTVENTGDEDGVTTVRVLADHDGLLTVVAESTEQLEVAHSHRVRHTLSGAGLAGAGALAVGPATDDVRLRADLS